MAELDHILWAAPDLDQGARDFAALTGVEAVKGGSHPGFGTRNFLSSFGGGHYFEIISPDPEQSLAGNRGGVIAALPHPGLITFALRASDLEGVKRAAESVGVKAQEPIHMTRRRPDGVQLEWAILNLSDATLGEWVPFLIDWKNSPHPADTTPGGCRLMSFTALHPQSDRLAEVYRAIGCPVAVKRAARPGFIAVLDTPRGEVVLTHP